MLVKQHHSFNTTVALPQCFQLDVPCYSGEKVLSPNGYLKSLSDTYKSHRSQKLSVQFLLKATVCCHSLVHLSVTIISTLELCIHSLYPLAVAAAHIVPYTPPNVHNYPPSSVVIKLITDSYSYLTISCFLPLTRQNPFPISNPS